MSWGFRLVSMEDADKVLSWRNDPEIYVHLFSPHPVTRENHMKWLNSTIQNTKIVFYIGNFNNEDVGTVRFDLDQSNTSAEVGIYIDPKFKGQGLGAQMLLEAEKNIKKKIPELKNIIAKVLLENVASEKMFLKTGYEKKFVQLEKSLEA